MSDPKNRLFQFAGFSMGRGSAQRCQHAQRAYRRFL